jgi:hypothetical protein
MTHFPLPPTPKPPLPSVTPSIPQLPNIIKKALNERPSKKALLPSQIKIILTNKLIQILILPTD